jgi:hypothetical protein
MNDEHTPSPQHKQPSGISDLDLDLDSPYVSHHDHKPSKPKRAWWKLRMPQTKKEWIITIAVLIALVGAGVAAYFIWFRDTGPAPVIKAEKTITKKPTVTPLVSKLTGLPISDAGINQRPVTAIMIENSPFARPQSGINEAGVVFEAVAEGGITRFLTLFQDSTPPYVGPVRSVRPYYVRWLMGFDAAVAHVGGSSQALQDIKTLGVKDLDQFHNPSAYHRISSREAPHNMYTSVEALRQLSISKGYTTSDYTGFARKKEAPSKTPTATSIDFTISGPQYNAHFDYDAATNSYKRSVGGKPHMVVDQDGKQTQLTPKVVIGLIMQKGSNGIYSTYNTIGDGEAYIFQDGVVTKGQWHKPNDKANFTFTDEAGKTVSLNPGQTWLTALGASNAITYK